MKKGNEIVTFRDREDNFDIIEIIFQLGTKLTKLYTIRTVDHYHQPP